MRITAQSGAPTPAQSQQQSQGPENRPETGPEQQVSRTAVFAAEHRAAERYVCPTCRAAGRDHCRPVDAAAAPIRRRGPRWHHAGRWAAALGFAPARSAERASTAKVIHSARTSTRPRPAPPARRLAAAPAGSLEARLRAALAGLHRDHDPEVIRAALDDAGLRLGLDDVRAWLDRISPDNGTRRPTPTREESPR